MTLEEWKSMVLETFPHINKGYFDKTSEKDRQYNCIAWAAGDTRRWWWPVVGALEVYWPQEAPRIETLDAFIRAFSTRGYELCENGELEPDIEKVAIYALGGKPTHMARQLSSGMWTSKLGGDIDIKHEMPKGVEDGGDYGNVVQFMKRPRHYEAPND